MVWEVFLNTQGNGEINRETSLHSPRDSISRSQSVLGFLSLMVWVFFFLNNNGGRKRTRRRGSIDKLEKILYRAKKIIKSFVLVPNF